MGGTIVRFATSGAAFGRGCVERYCDSCDRTLWI
jgi:hypothetical protein